MFDNVTNFNFKETQANDNEKYVQIWFTNMGDCIMLRLQITHMHKSGIIQQDSSQNSKP